MDSLEDDVFGRSARNPLGLCALSLIIGIIAFVMDFAMSQYIVGAIAGAVGLMIGGYAVNYANRSRTNANWKAFLILSGIGLCLSMVAFIYGFANGL
jgi:hypothetical protein